jgi:DNA-binding HxlR family transcriptional regulator
MRHTIYATSTDNKVGYAPKSEHAVTDSTTGRCTPEEASEALRILEGKWKLFIVFRLFEVPTVRFAELKRRIPDVSEKMLIQQLRDLEAEGIVRRTVYPEVPPKVEYSLTSSGHDLHPVLDELLKWWKKHHSAAEPKPRL